MSVFLFYNAFLRILFRGYFYTTKCVNLELYALKWIWRPTRGRTRLKILLPFLDLQVDEKNGHNRKKGIKKES